MELDVGGTDQFSYSSNLNRRVPDHVPDHVSSPAWMFTVRTKSSRMAPGRVERDSDSIVQLSKDGYKR